MRPLDQLKQRYVGSCVYSSYRVPRNVSYFYRVGRLRLQKGLTSDWDSKSYCVLGQQVHDIYILAISLSAFANSRGPNLYLGFILSPRGGS